MADTFPAYLVSRTDAGVSLAQAYTVNCDVKSVSGGAGAAIYQAAQVWAVSSGMVVLITSCTRCCSCSPAAWMMTTW